MPKAARQRLLPVRSEEKGWDITLGNDTVSWLARFEKNERLTHMLSTRSHLFANNALHADGLHLSSASGETAAAELMRLADGFSAVVVDSTFHLAAGGAAKYDFAGTAAALDAAGGRYCGWRDRDENGKSWDRYILPGGCVVALTPGRGMEKLCWRAEKLVLDGTVGRGGLCVAWHSGE